MNCKMCNRPVRLDEDGILCDSCLDDFESGMNAIEHDDSILDRLIREHTIRAKMPRCGLK
jgi:hypothetical protein